jgi:hypothetical protein
MGRHKIGKLSSRSPFIDEKRLLKAMACVFWTFIDFLRHAVTISTSRPLSWGREAGEASN